MIPKLSETTIRRHASAQSFERGQQYYRSGSVGSLVQRGQVLSASVEGSEVEPYRVQINLDPGGITQATCTCPYDYEGWCKHIIATLLTCLYQPEDIEQRPELTQLLADLNRNQLQTILENLADTEPEWLEAIEAQITQLSHPQATPSPKVVRRTQVDPKPIERQVQRILNQSAGQWDDNPALDAITELIKKADPFIEQGDGNNALILLGAIVRAYIQDWMNLDGSSGGSGMLFDDLDAALTEAILSADLSNGDRYQWHRDLTTWHSEVEDYGIASFAMSLTALEQGWDYPPLQRALAGEITKRGAWDAEAPDFADDLAQIRLLILARQGRHQEYLNLAQAEGQTEHYLTMLAKLGRTEDAIAQAQHQMSTPTEALALAQTLREQGELESARHIATQGLSLTGPNHYHLANWLSELAEGMGQPDNALQARIAAFKAQPSLADYLKVQQLASDQWSSLRQELLDSVQSGPDYLNSEAKVEIFLHENLIDDAIRTVEQLSSYQSSLIHPVMDAAVVHRPEWVIENARQRAESIMNAGKAQYYHHAVNWLRQVRAGYRQLGQLETWSRYRTGLLQTHARKRKLVALLQQRDLT